MLYFTYDGTGKITGLYDQASVRPEHASSAVECTAEQARQRFALVVQDGSLVAAPAGTYAPPPATADDLRVAAIEATIAADTTLAQLKAMTNAEFDTWWASNITNSAQGNAALKRVARVVLRRVL